MIKRVNVAAASCPISWYGVVDPIQVVIDPAVHTRWFFIATSDPPWDNTDLNIVAYHWTATVTLKANKPDLKKKNLSFSLSRVCFSTKTVFLTRINKNWSLFQTCESPLSNIQVYRHVVTLLFFTWQASEPPSSNPAQSWLSWLMLGWSWCLHFSWLTKGTSTCLRTSP